MAHQRLTAQAQRGSGGIGAEAVRIWLLGGFKVSVGSRSVEGSMWRRRKAGNLLKLLALAQGHRLHREHLMEVLWPDLDTKAQTNNLHRTLYFARRALDPLPSTAARYLAFEGELLALCPGGSLRVDAEAFEEKAATARRAREPAIYRVAIDLYAGELLPEDRYEEWAEERRGQLRRLYLELLVELGGLYEESAEFGAGIEALGKVMAGEPAHEEVHVGLMRLYALSGQQREALREYEKLEGELGYRPSLRARRLYEEIEAGRFSSERLQGPPREEPPERHNLPETRSSFVGRWRELVEVKRALAMSDLLTLTGAGGSGKTRLALEVARDLVGSYPEGVWLVELASLSEEALVANAVAAALGVREQPGRPLVETLVDSIRSRRMLLILDNCEHLIEATARLVDVLLSSCKLSAGPGYQPGGFGGWGRGQLVGALPHGTRYGPCACYPEPHALRGGTAVCGTCPFAADHVRPDARERPGGGQRMLEAGGHPSGHRAGDGADGSFGGGGITTV